MKLVIKHNNEISFVEINHNYIDDRDAYLRIKDNDIIFHSQRERILLSENKFELITPYTYDIVIVRVKDMVSRYSVLKNLESHSVEWLVHTCGIFNINNVEVYFVEYAHQIEIQVPHIAHVYLEENELKFDKVFAIERERVVVKVE